MSGLAARAAIGEVDHGMDAPGQVAGVWVRAMHCQAVVEDYIAALGIDVFETPVARFRERVEVEPRVGEDIRVFSEA